MTGAEALLYFTMQVTQASQEVGIEPPAVEAIYVNERSALAPANVVAYIAPWTYRPPTVMVMWHALWGYDERKLRCIARHEVIHVWRKHPRIIWPTDNARYETDVDYWLKEKWNEPAQCGLNAPVREARGK